MDNLRELIKEVLEKGYLMSLATVDDGGLWVADVIYIFDDELNIYWMSYPEVRHSKAIKINSKVAGTVTVSWEAGNELGVQFAGIAEKIDGPRFDLAKKYSIKKSEDEPTEAEDFLEGHSWYVMKPEFIELINGKLFGFKKQKFEIK